MGRLVLSFCQIPYLRPLLLCIPQCIRCTTSESCTVTDAVGRTVHQMPVAGQKGLTAGCVAAVDHLIDPGFNPRSAGLLGRCPATLVAAERQHQNYPDLRILPSQIQQFFRDQRIQTPVRRLPRNSGHPAPAEESDVPAPAARWFSPPRQADGGGR